jgi:hypothetical protein
MLIGARPLRAAISMLLTSSVIMARMVANTWKQGEGGSNRHKTHMGGQGLTTVVCWLGPGWQLEAAWLQSA